MSVRHLGMCVPCQSHSLPEDRIPSPPCSLTLFVCFALPRLVQDPAHQLHLLPSSLMGCMLRKHLNVFCSDWKMTTTVSNYLIAYPEIPAKAWPHCGVYWTLSIRTSISFSIYILCFNENHKSFQVTCLLREFRTVHICIY